MEDKCGRPCGHISLFIGDGWGSKLLISSTYIFFQDFIHTFFSNCNLTYLFPNCDSTYTFFPNSVSTFPPTVISANNAF